MNLSVLFALSVALLVCSACATRSLPEPSQPLPELTVAQPAPALQRLWQRSLAHAERPDPVLAKTLNLKISNLPAIHLLEIVHQELGLGYEADECGQEPLSLHGQNMPLGEVIRRVEAQTGGTVLLHQGQIRLECERMEQKIYSLNYLSLERRMSDISTLNSRLDGAQASQNALSQGNRSELELENSQSSAVWSSLLNQLELILAPGLDVTLSEKTEVTRTEQDKSFNSNRGTQSQTSTARDGIRETKTRTSRHSGRIVPHPESGTVAVTARKSEHARIEAWLSGIQQALNRQVRIEAAIAEVNLNDAFSSGINWSLIQRKGIELGLESTLNPLTGQSISLGLRQSSQGSEANLLIQLLEEFGSAKVVSTPRLTVMNQQPAVLKVIDSKVYFTTDVQTSAPTSTSPAFSTFKTQVQTVPVGFLMTVTPQISSAGDIQLRVRPTLSRILGFVEDPNPALRQLNISSRVPEIQTRELESILRLKSGETVLLGGLQQSGEESVSAGLPSDWVSPNLLTTAGSDSRSTTELVVMLRAEVLHGQFQSVVEESSVKSDARLDGLEGLLQSSLEAAALGDRALATLMLQKGIEQFGFRPELGFNLSLLNLDKGDSPAAQSWLNKTQTACSQQWVCQLPMIELSARIDLAKSPEVK